MPRAKPRPKRKPSKPANRPKPRPAPPPKPNARRGDYEAYRDRQAAASRRRSAGGREIGPPPPPADPERKRRCAGSLRFFCETYAGDQFTLEWSEDHIKAIALLEECIREGGLFALAMPRGSGKTTLAEIAAVWSIAYGYRCFVVLVAATGEKALEIVDRIKGFIESSEPLAEDFGEFVHPILKLEGITNRAAGQVCQGQPTHITWSKRQIVFPSVAGSKASGAIIRVAGITGAIRGAKHLTADGQSRRPDLALIDDASTEKSARSDGQNNFRERVIKRAVLRLAGPKQRIAALMLCTVIEKGDLADRFLDRAKNPEWRGQRCRMLLSFPTDEKHWEEYQRLRLEGLEQGDGGKAATAYYRKNRKVMDAGALASWRANFVDGELSAVQHAMNLFLEDAAGFHAEYQNDPQPEAFADGVRRLDPAALGKRLSGLDRHFVPRDCSLVTGMVDVSKHLLWYGIVAWNQRFGGQVIDYGCWPRQTRSTFKQSNARPNLATAHPGLGEPERIHAGLVELMEEILGRQFTQDGTGAVLRLDRVLIDAGYQTSMICQFVRSLQGTGTTVMASMGRGRTAQQSGVSEWKSRPGERRGYCWRQTMADAGRGYIIQFEPDAWKSFVADRFMAPLGGSSVLGVFGQANTSHQLFFDHLASEYGEPVEIRGKKLEKWGKVPPGDRDNHLLDCVVGAAVAASVSGLTWSVADNLRGFAAAAKPRVITQADIDREQRNRKTIRPGMAPE